ARGRGGGAGAGRADAWGARDRPARISVGRQRIVIVAEPVGAPLVADPGKIGESQRVFRRAADLRQPDDTGRRPLIAPREPRTGETAARGLFPFGFGGQSRRGPRGKPDGLVPAQPDDRLIGMIEPGL